MGSWMKLVWSVTIFLGIAAVLPAFAGCSGSSAGPNTTPGAAGETCNPNASGTDGCNTSSVCVTQYDVCYPDCSEVSCPNGTCTTYYSSIEQTSYSVCFPAGASPPASGGGSSSGSGSGGSSSSASCSCQELPSLSGASTGCSSGGFAYQCTVSGSVSSVCSAATEGYEVCASMTGSGSGGAGSSGSSGGGGGGSSGSASSSGGISGGSSGSTGGGSDLCAGSTAQPGGQYNSCVQQFYDPSTYNWLSFRNTCNVAIHIDFCAQAQPSNCFATDVPVGGSSNTGDSQSEVSSYGGFSLAVCGAGYNAWTPNGAWTAGAQFCCVP